MGPAGKGIYGSMIKARPATRALVAAAFVALLARSGLAADDPQPGTSEAEKAAVNRPGSGAGFPYRVKITVANDPEDLTPWLREVSQLAALEGDPPFTRMGLERRIQSDLDRFHKALRSRGYYDADLSADVRDSAPGPAMVEVRADPGPVYQVAKVAMDYQGVTDVDGLPQGADAVGLKLGQTARADDVLAGEKRLSEDLRKSARPLAKVVDKVVVVDHAGRTMEVTYVVEPGPAADFGALRVSGLDRVKESFVRKMVPWREGEAYDEDRLRELRKRLSDSRLFATVHLTPAAEVGADGRIPIDLTVGEGAHRTISAGVSYATDTGAGATLRWEHRNLLGAGEKFRGDVVAAQKEQSLDLTFRKPYFLDPRQTLTMNASVSREDGEAYSGEVGDIGMGLEREAWEHWRLSGGLAFEYGQLVWEADPSDERRRHMLAGVPLSAIRDGTDNLLDPTTGTRLALAATPFAGQVDGAATTFLVLETTGSAYYPAIENRLVLAGRARLASLTGADLTNVPPNHRLFAGGGGSVRGYGHNLIGPLNSDDDPTGGRSAAEIGVEARIKITETIGIVPFLDGGLVTTESWPSFSEDIRWGAGLGVRYHTSFGPLRADVAVPLNPRGSDDSFQVYISLGQAF
ncbi:hypothetical protein CKO38_02075 [Rhodospirillum rubrum]|nr:hypothetical protein [Rhodospirillum rubrum]MBK1675480.1 hypothetical protein [Rhodospirillum rubrum]